MKKVILLILDGFGLRESDNGNAIKMSNLPNLTRILNDYSVSELVASEEVVGLPKGVSGNSEVGHMTIGCGRTIESPLTYINNKIKDKSFFENDTLLDMMDHVNENNSTLHLIGLIQNSNVYSSMEHFYAVLALAKIRKVKSVIFHFITDGVTTLPNESINIISEFMQKVSKLGLGTIGTITGRYYAMDRDNNYDRVKKAYDAICYNVGNNFTDYVRCLELHYKNGIGDEFINPSIITKNSVIRDNDGVVFINFRPENMSELISAFTDESFNMFAVKKFKNVKYELLYGNDINVESAYSNEEVTDTFGEYLADLGFKQARISEAEKYSDVTYYFDGGKDFSDKNLYKILVPSPKVARYDMKPEMNALEVTSAVMEAIDEDFDFVLVNYANPDVIGHTGNIPACVRALEACDFCIGKILEKADENYYDLVITSSHGNCEFMKDTTGKVITTNTLCKVPFVVCDKQYKLKKEGTLKDVIPTIVDIYEISKPKEMTGESLIIKNN